MVDLSGKVCLVTGAGRTLGAVIARRMAQAGAHVAIHYQHAQREAETLCDELSHLGVRACVIQADVTAAADVARLLAETENQLGPLQILVNNVGPYVDAPFLELALEDFDRVWAGNVRSTFLLCQAAGRVMKGRGAGRIVNIAATDAFHRSHSVYGLAKSGVIHLSEALALELAPGGRHPCACARSDCRQRGNERRVRRTGRQRDPNETTCHTRRGRRDRLPAMHANLQHGDGSHHHVRWSIAPTFSFLFPQQPGK